MCGTRSPPQQRSRSASRRSGPERESAGHCIPADPLYLVHQADVLGLSFQLAEVAARVNSGMPIWVADRACKHLGDVGVPLGDARVLLLGVSYKADIADTRNSPAVPLARELRSRGVHVSFHDPLIPELRCDHFTLRRVTDVRSALGHADLTVLLQRHRAYHAALLMAARRLFDTTGPTAAPGAVTL